MQKSVGSFPSIYKFDPYYFSIKPPAFNNEVFKKSHKNYGLTKKLTEQRVSNLSDKLFVIGITGTNGKTTVAKLIGDVLTKSGCNCYVLGTLNSGDRNLSTPEIEDTMAIMEMHLLNGGTHFVMEVTSEAIDQSRVSGISFDLKLLTNITHDHLDYHETFENYSKTKLDFMLQGDAFKIYPVDFLNEKISFNNNLIGDFNLENTLAAATVARSMRVDKKIIEEVLSNCSAPSGRMERIDKGQNFQAFVDFAHTPDSLSGVLATLRKESLRTNGRLILVFGCGGERDSKKRPIMGKIASELADFIVITEDNPRKENSHKILEEIEAGICPDFKSFEVIKDRREAIGYAINLASRGDVIVVTGKGHENYQILNSGEVEFEDKKVVNSFLELSS
jgi:UDP-N-acetylmuramoyl-L-alanyl-D-glutamate--2,6-diaminopimelate ligase